jgi:hypothetical protein
MAGQTVIKADQALMAMLAGLINNMLCMALF